MAPAVIFDDQADLKQAFDAGALDKDCIVIVRCQGPSANGMPELHKLTPYLGILQDRGHKVALVTDGRMSGASGKVPAAIHVTPEAVDGGVIGRISGRRGCAPRCRSRHPGSSSGYGRSGIPSGQPKPDPSASQFGFGRELFAGFRQHVGAADKGAAVF